MSSSSGPNPESRKLRNWWISKAGGSPAKVKVEVGPQQGPAEVKVGPQQGPAQVKVGPGQSLTEIKVENAARSSRRRQLIVAPQASLPHRPATLVSPAGDRQRSAPEATSWSSTSSCSRTAHGQPHPRIARGRLRLRLRLSAHQPPPGARPLCDRLPQTQRPATLDPRNAPAAPLVSQECSYGTACVPRYTPSPNTKTIPILAGVGGGDSTFPITKK
jgi:hypothetical protein